MWFSKRRFARLGNPGKAENVIATAAIDAAMTGTRSILQAAERRAQISMAVVRNGFSARGCFPKNRHRPILYPIERRGHPNRGGNRMTALLFLLMMGAD